MNKFKIGEWVCDIGDQSFGIQIINIREGGKLICDYPSPITGNMKQVHINSNGVELWKTKHPIKTLYNKLLNITP